MKTVLFPFSSYFRHLLICIIFEEIILSFTTHRYALQVSHFAKVLMSLPSVLQYIHFCQENWYSGRWLHVPVGPAFFFLQSFRNKQSNDKSNTIVIKTVLFSFSSYFRHLLICVIFEETFFSFTTHRYAPQVWHFTKVLMSYHPFYSTYIFVKKTDILEDDYMYLLGQLFFFYRVLETSKATIKVIQ